MNISVSCTYIKSRSSSNGERNHPVTIPFPSCCSYTWSMNHSRLHSVARSYPGLPCRSQKSGQKTIWLIRSGHFLTTPSLPLFTFLPSQKRAHTRPSMTNALRTSVLQVWKNLVHDVLSLLHEIVWQTWQLSFSREENIVFPCARWKIMPLKKWSAGTLMLTTLISNTRMLLLLCRHDAKNNGWWVTKCEGVLDNYHFE